MLVLLTYPNDVYIKVLLNGMTPVLKHNKSQTTTYLQTIVPKMTLDKLLKIIGNVLVLIKDRYKRERRDPLEHYE